MSWPTGRPAPESRRPIVVILALALLLAPTAPAASAAFASAGAAVGFDRGGGSAAIVDFEPGVGAGPVVGGVALEGTIAAGHPIYFDRQVPPEVIAAVAAALDQTLVDVPRLSGLPPFVTPIAIHLLADQDRFRLALAEIGRVRVELVANEVGGYTIERDGTMLTFFPYRSVASPVDAAGGLAHELAHLAEREATARRPFPQWFNEGYASRVAERVMRERFPADLDDLPRFDRAVVASALHTRGGLLPWADLVTRTRFSRAGVEGQASLAYAQSTRFVDWLARRHGPGALAAFLQAIGAGATPTRAFESTFGPFPPQAAELEAELAATRAEFPPGLHLLTTHPRCGRPVYLAVVGGAPNERISVEMSVDGQPVATRERSLDPAGFGVVLLDGADTRAGTWLVRADSPGLGLLAVSVTVTRPRPAPVQLPHPVAAAARHSCLAG